MTAFFLNKSKEAQDAHPRIAASIRHIARCVDRHTATVSTEVLNTRDNAVVMDQIVSLADNLSLQLLESMEPDVLGIMPLLMEPIASHLDPTDILSRMINNGASDLEDHVNALMGFQETVH